MAVAFLLILRPSCFETRPSRSSSVAFRNATVALTWRSSFFFFDRLVSKRDRLVLLLLDCRVNVAVAFLLLLRPSHFETRPSRSCSSMVSFRNTTVSFFFCWTVALTWRSPFFFFFDRLILKRDRLVLLLQRSRFETRPSRFETRLSLFEAFRNATVAFLNATVAFLNATVALTWWLRFFFDRLVSKRDCRVNVVVAFLLRPSHFETRPSRSSSVAFRNATVTFRSVSKCDCRVSKRDCRKRDCRVNVVVAFLLRPSRFETRPSRSSSVAFRNATVALTWRSRFFFFDRLISKRDRLVLLQPSRFDTRLAFRSVRNATVTFLNATVALTWWSRFFFDRLVSKRDCHVSKRFEMRLSRFETRLSRF